MVARENEHDVRTEEESAEFEALFEMLDVDADGAITFVAAAAAVAGRHTVGALCELSVCDARARARRSMEEFVEACTRYPKLLKSMSIVDPNHVEASLAVEDLSEAEKVCHNDTVTVT